MKLKRKSVSLTIESFKNDASYDANHYFYLFKIGLEYNKQDMTILLLSSLQTLISLGYLTGDC